MRYAIVESGGKQYRAVEGQELDVDRLPGEQGAEISLERVLMMADDADFMIGTPTVAGIEIRATVVDHVSRPQGDPLPIQPEEENPRARRTPAAVHPAAG